MNTTFQCEKASMPVAQRFGLVAGILLLLCGAGSVAASSKYACDFSNRLCQWSARYMFGATVLGDLAFFNGGILSNDASTPVNGSAFEVLDMRTMSPLVIQVEDNKSISTSRYRHQLMIWRDKILAVGGQHDDANGASQPVINVIELDLNTREWTLRKQFTQPGGTVDVIIDTSVVVGDELLMVYQILDPSGPRRELLHLNLNTGKVTHTVAIASGAVQVLDWPLTAVMPLSKDAKFPYLVMQFKRQPKLEDSVWLEVSGEGKMDIETISSLSASTQLRQLPGGVGGKILTLGILQVMGKPNILTWAVTTAVFADGRQATVNAVTLHDVKVARNNGRATATLSLLKVFMTLPFNVSTFNGLQSVDLPFHGTLAVSAADVITLPYLGEVDLIGEKDSSNVNIQEWPGKGFIVRGSSLADHKCQPMPTWQPFVLSVDLAMSSAMPSIRVVSNNTWCNTRHAQLAASGIVGDAAELSSNTKLFRVDSRDGQALVVLSPQRRTNEGGQLSFPDTTAPLRGAFINMGDSTVHNFSVLPIKGYKFPAAVASCLAQLNGASMYLQSGGYYQDETAGRVVSTDFIGIPLQNSMTQHAMVKVAGSSPSSNTVFSSLACSPDGTVYTFGGLKITDYTDVTYDYYDEGNNLVTEVRKVPVWAASGSLHAAKLDGSIAAPSLSQHIVLSDDAGPSSKKTVPSPRSGHTLSYLPPETVANLGFSKGALLLYGGSNITQLDMSATLTSELVIAEVLSSANFDRIPWLFDLETRKWIALRLDGLSDAPPGLMYHSADVQGKQLMLWGGVRFIPQNLTLRISTNMYVLDFSTPSPRWRKAAVDHINVQGAFQMGFPNSGVAALPEHGAVALMHRAGVSLSAIPQSLQVSGSNISTHWGLQTLNLTAGDWVRLEVSPGAEGLAVQQPLLVGSDVIVSGVVQATTAMAGKEASRGLLKQTGVVSAVLSCGRNATAAVVIRSSGAVIEDLTISDCNDTAVRILVDATGAYTTPATLRNLKILNNNGTKGSALYLGPAAAAVLDSCLISSNNATVSNIFAEPGSQLVLMNSTVADNRGTGVLFAGSVMTVTGCNFSRNSATAAPASATGRNTPLMMTVGQTTAASGGALRVICESPSLVQYFCESIISNSSFEDNLAHSLGGAVYLGAGTFTRLVHSSFSGNSARDGGAVVADRDACLYNMTGVVFNNNMATKRGGAILMRGASCRSSITWQDAAFSNNSAGAGGGAMHVAEMINRNISGQAVFYNNTVKRTSLPSAAPAGTPDMDAGGALFLGLWNSIVTLYNTTLANNSATGSGGAVNILSIDSRVTLTNVTARHNFAGVPLTIARSYSLAVQSKGGAVHMQGSAGRLVLLGVNMTGNSAGRGGAISMNPDLGELSSVNSSFAGNTALLAGGAVAITQHKAAIITNTTFHGNHLRWPALAAGGGFYCFLCERVVISGSVFDSNIASYGGGAAVLQTSGPASINDTLFINNLALSSLYVGSEAQRRRLLAEKEQHLDVVASLTRPPLQVQNLPADVLGPFAGNTTGDSGYYTGGGGLYLSLNSRVVLDGSGFADNVAWNGGGLVARTEACKRLQSAGQPCQLVMSKVSILKNNLATGAGNGLLVTDIGPATVVVNNCSVGNVLNTTTTSGCLLKPNRLTAAWQSISESNRMLLGLTAEQPTAAVGTSGMSDFLVTSAASIQCRRMINPPAGLQLSSKGCREVVRAGPGIPIDVALQLIDGLGRPVANGTFDANMPIMASLLNTDGVTSPNILLIGNTTQAIFGRAYFPGLKINGKPGEEYKLVFRTTSGLNLTRDLVLRACQAGEVTLIEQYSSDASYQCESCTSPQYSFYPEANTCGQCSLLQQSGSSSYSICTAAAVIPADGVYQSHPRNPLLHRCITSSACTRTWDIQLSMAQWANAHAAMTITDLNQINQLTSQPYYQPYMDMMCATGYTGPLCGACIPGFGHSGQRCISCMSRNVNSFLFFLTGLFMFLVPALQTLLHSKKVQRWHSQGLGTGDAGYPSLGAGHPETKAITPHLKAGRQQHGAKPGWITEHAPVEFLDSSEDCKNGQMLVLHGSMAAAPGARCDTAAMGRDQLCSVVYSLTPYMSEVVPSAVTAAVAAGANGQGLVASKSSGTERHPSEASSCDVFPFARPSATPDTIRMPSGDQQLPCPTTAAVAAGEAALPQALPGFRAHLPKSISSGLFGSLFSIEPLDNAGELTGLQGGVAVVHQQMPSADAGATLTAHGKSGGVIVRSGSIACAEAKFYHTDVVTMIVGYMQLLGLLRFVRLNWSAVLKPLLATLTFLDFTSGVSTWISLECSFRDELLLSKSLQRSLVLILWPIGALLFLGIVWISYAAVRTWRRGITAGLKLKLLQLKPYMVLSALTMTYFLYTPTSREVIALFSCQPVDTVEALQRVAPQSHSTPDAVDALRYLTSADSRWLGVWSSDTSVSCGSPVHMGFALGLGLPGLAVWVLGLPVALWVLLKRHSRTDHLGHRKLDDPQVELMFGLMYDKYRRKHYYWECVVLLENCALTLLLVLLQPQPAPLQIVVAMAVIFIGVVLHISFRPFACRMLDTLRRLEVYGLMSTLFVMMLVSLDEVQQMPGLSLAAVVVILVVNLVVLGVHCWAVFCELRRWLLHELNVTDREHLTWNDIRRVLQALKTVVSTQASRLVRVWSGDQSVAEAAQVDGAQHVPRALDSRSPIQEFTGATVTAANAV